MQRSQGRYDRRIASYHFEILHVGILDSSDAVADGDDDDAVDDSDDENVTNRRRKTRKKRKSKKTMT